MKEKRKKEGGFKPNEAEIRGTTFSGDLEKDRAPLIGKVATTVTTLKPTGEIRLKGRFYDAVAQGTFIDSDQAVRVTGTRDFRLVVEKVA